MSKIKIVFEKNSTLEVATGNSLVEAASKIKGANGQEIFGAHSKPSVAALIARCKRNGVDIKSIEINGQQRFSADGSEESGSKEAEEGQTWEEKADEKKGGGKKSKAQKDRDAEAEAEAKEIEEQKQEEQESEEENEADKQEQKADPDYIPEEDEIKMKDEMFKQLAKNIKPHLDIKDQDIDLTKVNEIIKETVKRTVAKMSKEITIKPLYGGADKKLGKQHYMFEDLLHFVTQRKNIMLVGPAGGGKTTGAHEVAKALDLEFYAISVGMMSTKADFLGFFNAQGKYIETQFRSAFEKGGVFLLDELDAGNPNVITTINMALANGHAAFPDKMVTRHKDFVLIAGANTYGSGADRQYVGRNQLDAATTDRFPMMTWDYDEKLEMELSGNNKWTEYIQALRANVVKKGLRVIVSPRMSIEGAHMLKAGMTKAKVNEYIVFKGLDTVQRKQLTEGVTPF